MILELRKWFLGLVELLSNQSGDNEGEGEKGEGEGEGSGEGEGEGEEGKSGDADDDSGKDVGKDRSKFIPRERFDAVNKQAQKLSKLIETGIVAEGEDGELRLNPEAIKRIMQPKEGKSDDVDFRFTKDEVDEKSWPLVNKINLAYDYYDKAIGGLFNLLLEVQSAFQAVDQYPEYLQKDSALKKKALEIMKNDPEFKATYAKNPKKFLWAVKRAYEALSVKPPETKPKPKSSFIVGKGDAGKTGVKKIDLTKLTKDELDKLERQEHERIESQRKQGKK